MPDNLHTLAHSHHPLGVECPCGRRALVDGKVLGAHDGNMTELDHLPLKCSVCGSRPKVVRLFYSQADVDAFMGAPVGRVAF